MSTQRSTRTPRTPPAKATQIGVAGAVLSVCGTCDGPEDDSRMVQCDGCDQWHHFECVGVGESISEKDFYCPGCSKQKAASTQLKTPASQALATGETTAESSLDTTVFVNPLEIPKIKSKQLSSVQTNISTVPQSQLNTQLTYTSLVPNVATSQTIKSQISTSQNTIPQNYFPVSQIPTAHISGSKLIDNGVVSLNNFGAHPAVPNNYVLQSSASQLPGGSFLASSHISDVRPTVTSALVNGQLPVLGPHNVATNCFPTSYPGVPSNIYSHASIPQSNGATFTPFASYASVHVPQPTSVVNNNPYASSAPSFSSTENGQYLLTANQLAARQVMSKELPVFSGSPYEWPLFISSASLQFYERREPLQVTALS